MTKCLFTRPQRERGKLKSSWEERKREKGNEAAKKW